MPPWLGSMLQRPSAFPERSMAPGCGLPSVSDIPQLLQICKPRRTAPSVQAILRSGTFQSPCNMLPRHAAIAGQSSGCNAHCSLLVHPPPVPVVHGCPQKDASSVATKTAMERCRPADLSCSREYLREVSGACASRSISTGAAGEPARIHTALNFSITTAHAHAPDGEIAVHHRSPA